MTPEEHSFRDFFKYLGTPMTADEYNLNQAKNGLPQHDFVKMPEVFMQLFTQELIGKQNSFGVSFKYFCGLIGGLKKSALVGLHKDVFCIGVYEGLLLSIIELAYLLVKTTRFMPDVGASHAMPIRRSDGSVPGTLWQHNLSRGLPLFSSDLFDVPCAVRQEAAEQLVREMTLFIVLHELSHIIMGHVGYTKNFLSSAYIDEIIAVENKRIEDDDPAWQGHSSKNDIIRRVFEYDADLNATSLLLRIPLTQFFVLTQIDDNVQRRLRIIAPFLVLFLFLPDWLVRANDLVGDSSHPEPFKRMYALQTQLREHGGLLSLRRAGLYDDPSKDLASIASAIGSLEMATIAVSSSIVDKVWSYDFKEEYKVGESAEKKAIPYGFGSDSQARDGIVVPTSRFKPNSVSVR